MSLVVLGDSTAVGLGDPLPGGGWRGFGPLLAAALGAADLLPHAAALVLRDLLGRPAAVPSRCVR